MKAGKLDRRIRIERFTSTDDGYNTVETWGTLKEVAASYTPARGSERFELLGREATVKVIWGIRWLNVTPPLSAKDRLIEVVAGQPVGPYFDITDTTQIGRREGIEIYATAGDNG